MVRDGEVMMVDVNEDDRSADLLDDSPLSPEESLDDDELDYDVDSGYAPATRARGVSAWGTTPREARGHEDLAHRLAAEEPETYDDPDADGLGDVSDTDGELVDDQVGCLAAGRLISWDLDATDVATDFLARDVGVDGGATSPEEDAVHVVTDTDGPY
jgi:hypothetical protein